MRIIGQMNGNLIHKTLKHPVLHLCLLIVLLRDPDRHSHVRHRALHGLRLLVDIVIRAQEVVQQVRAHRDEHIPVLIHHLHQLDGEGEVARVLDADAHRGMQQLDEGVHEQLQL